MNAAAGPTSDDRHVSGASSPAAEHPLAAFARLNTHQPPVTRQCDDLSAIGEADLPCVLILRDGSGLAALSRNGDGDFELVLAGGSLTVSPAAIQEAYAGLLMTPSIADEQPADAASLRIDDEDERPEPLHRRIVRRVLASKGLGELFLAAAISNVFAFALPLYSMSIYDRVIPHRAVETLWALTFGIAIIFAIDALCRAIRNRSQEAIGASIALDLQQRLFERQLSSGLMKANRSPAALSSAVGAVEGAALLTPTVIVGLLIDVPFAIIAMIYIAILAKWVVLAPLLALVAVAAVSVWSHLAAKKAHEAAAKSSIERQGMIEESVAALQSTKAVAAERVLAGRWSRLIDLVLYQGHQGRLASATAGVGVDLIMKAGTVLCLLIGVFIISHGGMSVGALVAATLLSARAVAPIGVFASQVVRLFSLHQTLMIADRLLSLPAEKGADASREDAPVRGKIDFVNLSFRYPNEPRDALAAISLSIRPGERVGVIGRIGSGKSTLLQMIPHFYSPDSGGVLIDDHDIRQFDPSSLRRSIAYMSQDCELFEGSLRDNIVRGLPQVNEEMFDIACRASGVYDFASTHPLGYSMALGGGGRRLSGGERQAVCLARALVRDARVLTLDEPTSAMDSQMERKIIENLKGCLQGRTVLIATHRMPLLSLVDRIIWLDNGRVIADGPRETVMRDAARMSA